MSIYIEPNNQRILWGMIHKHPSISTVFPNQESKEVWFKSIISKIYSELPSNISREMLFNKNKETLSIMNGEINARRELLFNPVVKKEESKHSYSREVASKTRIETLNQDYLVRQKDYEQMIQKPAVPQVKFEEKVEDGVIKNMDELIQKQLREREQDMKAITESFQQNTNVSVLNSPKIKIEEEISKESIRVEEPIKKRVTWNIDVDNKISQTIPIKIEVKIEELSERISLLTDFLGTKFPHFLEEYNDFSTKKIVREILEEQIEKI
jgi:hypothetical protein